MKGFRVFIDLVLVVSGCMIIGSILMTWGIYRDCKDTVERQFPELIRLVAEDNCLDNTIPYSGVTMYQAYRNKLEKVEETNPLIDFDKDAISVESGGVTCYDRASAPQKGSTLQVKLTCQFDATFPLFSLPIHRTFTYDEPVIGIRFYRDRE